jgi:hypothetical protein
MSLNFEVTASGTTNCKRPEGKPQATARLCTFHGNGTKTNTTFIPNGIHPVMLWYT